MKIDKIDRKIIQLLQHDGKMKIKEIANALKMTNTPIFDRIKRLEKNGVIAGYSTIVDKDKLGFQLVAFCEVSLESHQKEFLRQFVQDIKNLPEVVECYHMAGTIDYMLKIFVQDMTHYQTFIADKLAALPNIGRVRSSFVMTEIKNHHVLPVNLEQS